VATLPFVIGVLRNPDVVMVEGTAAQDHTVTVGGDAFNFTLMNIAGYNLHRWAIPDAPPDHPIYAQDEVQLLLALELVVFIAQAVGLALYAWRARRTPAGAFSLAILIWAFSYTVVFTVQWAPVHPHYLIALWPAPYLVIAAGLATEIAILRARGQAWRTAAALGLALVMAIAGAQVYMLHRFFTYAGAHFTPGDFGAPLGMKMQGAQAAIDLLESSGAPEIIVLGEGDRPYQYEGPGAFDVMLHNVPHRFVNAAHSAALPDHPAVILVQPRVSWPAAPWYEATSKEAARIPLRADEGEYVLYLYSPAGRDARLGDFVPAPEPNLLENGARLLGYRWTVARAGEHIDVAWRVEGPPPFTNFDTIENDHIVVYFYDPGAGAAVAQTDGPAHWPPYWEPGDIVITRLPMIDSTGLDREGLELRAAMYRYPGIVRARLADGSGDSVLLDAQ
ncbi:MAG: hypothetical protein JXB47_16100, partial [Anaerolineae bacterium]|nr:hypothetical protein [Anaerolineae bacterium]